MLASNSSSTAAAGQLQRRQVARGREHLNKVVEGAESERGRRTHQPIAEVCLRQTKECVCFEPQTFWEVGLVAISYFGPSASLRS